MFISKKKLRKLESDLDSMKHLIDRQQEHLDILIGLHSRYKAGDLVRCSWHGKEFVSVVNSSVINVVGRCIYYKLENGHYLAPEYILGLCECTPKKEEKSEKI